MSISIDNWNDFMYNIGQDFYDFIHSNDSGADQNTQVHYPVTLQYKGAYTIPLEYGGDSYRLPVIVDFALYDDLRPVFSNPVYCVNSNLTGVNVSQDFFDDTLSLEFDLLCANSYTGFQYPYIISSRGTITKMGADGGYHDNIFQYDFYTRRPRNGIPTTVIDTHNSGLTLNVTTSSVSLSESYNGYDYYFSSGVAALCDNNFNFLNQTATPINTSPLIINTRNSNNVTINNSFKNQWVFTGDNITNYTYYIDNSDSYITINYSTDNDGVPTGYIDINPSGNISFDDLFDMFNTILAPLVGVGLDLPDWTDYEPEYPIVTGDINVNIDLPDVTGEYPAETITPIDSDVYNIMSIDSMPQLPSLTGIDNGESAAALGSSFTFLDGCGLLMPFVTIAIIRLLISKFRGDS